jgi:hypothetical protein
VRLQPEASGLRFDLNVRVHGEGEALDRPRRKRSSMGIDVLQLEAMPDCCHESY